MNPAPTSSGYEGATEETGVADVERAALCDVLEQVGPSAPTLCEGWDTAHLAAHLVMREGTPLGPLKTLRPNVAAEETEEIAAITPFEELVDRLRGGPSRLSLFGHPALNKLGNTVEFFIHHEDVRRAQQDWARRELPAWAEEQIWRRLRPTVRLMLRKAPVGVELRRTDTGERLFAVKKLDTVVVAGLPSEIALFVSGRTEVSQAELDGDPAHIERLRATRMGQ